MSGTKKKAGGRAKKAKPVSSPQKKAALGKAASVRKAIAACERQLADGNMKPTVGEYVRLLELQKQIDGDDLREIKVTWVEPGETESSSEK